MSKNSYSSAPTPPPIPKYKPKTKARRSAGSGNWLTNLDRGSLTTVLILSGVLVITIIFMIYYRRTTFNASLDPIYAAATQAGYATQTAAQALALGTALPAQDPAVPVLEQGVFRERNFSLRVPSGWEPLDPTTLPSYAQARASGGEIVLLASPPGSGSALVVTRMPWEGGGLDQFVAALQPAEESQPEAETTSQETTINGLPAIRRTIIIPGSASNDGVQVAQVFLLPEQAGPPAVYIIEISADQAFFQENLAAIEETLGSIEFE